MKIVFVYYAYENQGSSLDLQGYARTAREMGHEATVYGWPKPTIPLNYSIELAGADAVVFVFEWTTKLLQGDQLDWMRLVTSVPRNKRLIIDCDGRYNEKIVVHGDYNHKDSSESSTYIDFCDALADKIYQPTLSPVRSNVGTFFFHIYDPFWERPLDFSTKEFGIVYVGHSKFRWHGMEKVMRAVEPVRERVGRIGLYGFGWDKQPDWAATMDMEDVYEVDYAYMQKLGVETIPPIPSSEVINAISNATINPVVYRPLFERLGFVTCRTFEVPAAGTLPLFVLNKDYVKSIYGTAAAAELLLPEKDPHAKIDDMLARPDYYASIVQEVREEFKKSHSPKARLQQLFELIAA